MSTIRDVKIADGAQITSQVVRKPKQSKVRFIYRVVSSAESLWKILLIVVSILSAILFKNVYVFQTNPYFDGIRKGHFIDLIWGPVIAVFLYAFQTTLKRRLKNFVTNQWLRKDKYLEPASRNRRIELMCKWMYTIPYYVVNACIGYWLLKDTDALPVWLGGYGKCVNIYAHSPYVLGPASKIKIYFIVAFGKSLGHCITHMFVKPEGNYYEYALHHVLTVFLIVFSYLMNFWTAGVMILMIHDLSDAILALVRLYTVRLQVPERLAQTHHLRVGRHYLDRVQGHYPCQMLRLSRRVGILYTESQPQPPERQIMEYPQLLMGGMVYVLGLLNLFWTYFLINKGIVTYINKNAKVSMYQT